MPLLGAIADDFTGATDLAGVLRAGGLRVAQLLGVPESDPAAPEVDVVVVALKSRSVPAADAVADSLAALAWLRRAGCRQFFFKYCSTFDSTPDGNIGPVASALLAALDEPFTIACPAYPENGRTVREGCLYVGNQRLNESGMEHHPLTPMTDANLVRWLQRQTPDLVGLIDNRVVDAGPSAIKSRVGRLKGEGVRIAIADAVKNEDLYTLGEALGDLKLITGGSGIALGLPRKYREKGWVGAPVAEPDLEWLPGSAAIICGSCSVMTRKQIAFAREHCTLIAVAGERLRDSGYQEELAEQSVAALGDKPALIYSSADPDGVADLQRQWGAAEAGARIERLFACVATAIVAAGAHNLVVAGGETSGAVAAALGGNGLRIGQPIAPGVPWTRSLGERPLNLALKSGNFGAEDFFVRAFEKLVTP